MPIITLTSDFGLQDHIAASVKGQIIQHCNTLPTIVDVTHQITPYNLSQSAYIIESILPNYPNNTYHCVFVNLYHNYNSELLCVRYNNQYIFCANNGFINMVSKGKPMQVVAIPTTDNSNFITLISTIINVINWLDSGADLESLGILKNDYIVENTLEPDIGDNWLEGHLQFIDNYENVVTNISKALFNKVRGDRKFNIVFKRDELIDHISEHYNDVPKGEKVAIFNASGYLEIAINGGNAAGLFGFQNSAQTQNSLSNAEQNNVFYKTIKIYFE